MTLQAELEVKMPFLNLFDEYRYQADLLKWIIQKAVQTYSKDKVCLTDEEIDDFILSKLKQKNEHGNYPEIVHSNLEALLPCSPQS